MGESDKHFIDWKTKTQKNTDSVIPKPAKLNCPVINQKSGYIVEERKA